ncbi:gag-Pol polyprotein [Rhodotorula toruloides]|uniref:Gag-Pol polyprotein n=1 Tax=Rhodotorula toruloides TaxID=5286 RepID=A0A511KEY7_RHOTO|nr:gag-Pol polyprotein [Rhodotorula toruloides]
MLAEHGIIRESPPPYSPQSDGVAERVNRSIVEGIVSLLAQAGAPKALWAEALQAFVFVKNRSPHAALSGNVPLAVWRNRPARVDMLRTWGCRAWHTVTNGRSKLDDRAIPLIFVGYDGDTAAYRLFDPVTRKTIRSRDTRSSTPSSGATCHVPPDAKILGCRFVYRRKKDKHGRVTGHKVRLVAQGFSQRPGVDFRDTFAPVAKFTSIRVLLALAARQKMLIHQADVDKAYLHGSLDEELYMRIPKGIDSGEYSGKVLKVDRALYGLKQAGRGGGGPPLIALYVDNLLFVSPSLDEITRVKAKDLGAAKFILGIQIHQRSDGSLFLSQRAYLEDVLLRLDPNSRRTAPRPVVRNQQLVPAPDDHVPTPDFRRRYLQAVGSLMYAMLGTRVDLAHVVGVLSRHAARPDNTHWAAVLRALQYIRGTLDYGLEYTPDSSPLRGFEAYSDSDWGTCPTTSRSTMGYDLLLANGAVSWSSKLQPRVTASSTEAEYLRLSHACKETVYLTQLLGELGFPAKGAAVLCCDNQGANALSKGPQFHNCTRHLHLTEHFVREQVQDGSICVEYIPTARMLADAMTKSLPAPLFERHRDAFGVRPLRARGGGVAAKRQS